MSSLRNLRATYMPVVKYKPTQFDATRLELDLLRASYLDLDESLDTYSVITVSSKNEGQPDWFAYEAWGDESLWWVIMLYNQIIFVNEIVQGLQLKIPSIDTVALYLERQQSKLKTTKRNTIVVA